MVKRALWIIPVSFAWLFLARPVFAVDQVKPTAFHEELGQAWGVLGRELQGLFNLWQEHFGYTGTREEGPPISMIIRNREKLGLSNEQVRNLERLRNDFGESRFARRPISAWPRWTLTISSPLSPLT